MHTDETRTRFTIHMSAEIGSSGLTATANYLSRILRVPRIAGGGLLRALAFDFDQQRPQLKYTEYLAKFTEIFADSEHGMATILRLLAPHLAADRKDDVVLDRFHNQIEAYPHQNSPDPILWDWIVDRYLVTRSNELPGYAIDAKLSMFLRKIDELRQFWRPPTEPTLPPFNVLLTVSPQVAARRALAKTGLVDDPSVEAKAANLIGRFYKDLRRYTKYHVNGVPIQRADFITYNDLQVYTDAVTPPQVAESVWYAYLVFLTRAQMAGDAPAFNTAEQEVISNAPQAFQAARQEWSEKHPK